MTMKNRWLRLAAALFAFLTLTAADWPHRLGSNEAPSAPLFNDAPASFADPEILDWRSKDGLNWLGPVMNQGNCGSCVAFATVATLEAQAAIDTGMPWLRASFSPQALFACGGGSCDRGWFPTLASAYVRFFGVIDEACLPYTSGSTGKDVACSAKCSSSKTRTLKVSGTRRGGRSVESVKLALKRGPLVTTLQVYADFMNYTGGIYRHRTGEWLGGHAVSIIGFDDTRRAWLIRNSWGEEWGEKGYAWVSWDDTSGVGASTWGFEFDQESFPLTITSPQDREVVSGPVALSARAAPGARASGFQFRLTDSGGKVLPYADCHPSSADHCEAKIDTAKLPDGRYEILALNGQGVSSQPREFFILNQAPSPAIEVAPAPGVDLAKPLKNRPEFDVKVRMNGDVPLDRLELQVFSLNPGSENQLVGIKSSSQVLPKMRLGWRTTTVPNGRYRLRFRGEIAHQGRIYSAESTPIDVSVSNGASLSARD